MSDADLAEILKLRTEAKLRLVELLWESLSATPSAILLGDAHPTAISEALAEHRQNLDAVLTLDQVVSDVRSRR